MSDWEHAGDTTVRIRTYSEMQTRDAARRLAFLLRAGDVICLIGDLGAGKTHFVKAVAEALDVPFDEVNSPTFTLIQEYAGSCLIRHCDTYRLRSAEEFADLGLDELFASDGITLIEWADRVEEYLPRDRLEICLGIDSPNARTIEVTAKGRRSREILASLA